MICLASSLVGHTHIDCGKSTAASALLNMHNEKAAVFPVPDCACAIRFFGLLNFLLCCEHYKLSLKMNLIEWMNCGEHCKLNKTKQVKN